MTPRQPFEALLDALMHVEEPELKVQHRLTGDAKSKVAGLDDPRVDGSDGHLEHAFTGHGSERVKITWHARHHGVVREVLAKRPGPIGPVVMEGDTRRVRMALRNKAEEIHDLAFEPVGHRILRGDRRIRRFSRKHGRREPQEGPEARQEPQMVQEKSPADIALVAREEGEEPSAQTNGDAVGEVRQRGRGRLEQKLAGPGLTNGPLRHSQRG